MAKPKLVAFYLSLALGGALCHGSVSAAPEPASPAVSQNVHPAPKPEAAAPSLQEQVSINEATAEQLSAAMNGVGLKKAQAIVNYREQYGPFSAIQQLNEVPGIGNALIERNASRLKL
ncbi:ComEA family DNA-binding protein [Pantoea sp. Bo_2]|uniref:ComEA family DNA-binding protein n=1 Tax=Candidatus Pantoea gossypiicola TaxID=2608008 RepID=A0AB34CLC6_9GAMM|nr:MULTISPECIES: helix-hairpin-helix domain-containing protein [Pantoea]KAA5928659.1 ComEA family DNA-binding protein [Pantoea sp. VH_8]KAA5933748.1 ComEA family DNA-binding protein [Pantoea sp. VH_4]KAA5945056.1 ComEA family DNA-binding protein [Pantoea sp. VH_3]KAA5954916.1 ComEA family DNA-binding protein [Pantoea sp. VH_24]KAA5956936.1 ComEA family DNA-binding protein [Pantoea sp. VH_25]